MNYLLTRIPSHEEIKMVVFSLNQDNAPGPDGFGGVFYKMYQIIFKKGVCDVVLQIFKNGWIISKFNSNIIILVLKSKYANAMSHFRPIALANFKLKTITKLLQIDQLFSCLIQFPRSKEFIQGRCIRDCICLASERVNHLDNTSFGETLPLRSTLLRLSIQSLRAF